MNRRGFIGALAGAFGAAAYDPERALWVRGEKLISIPKPRVVVARAVDFLLHAEHLHLPPAEFHKRYLVPAMVALGRSVEECSAVAAYDVLRNDFVIRFDYPKREYPHVRRVMLRGELTVNMLS